MRAQPEMQPWVHTDKSRMSSAGAALTVRVFALCRIVSFVEKVPPLRGSRNVRKQ